MVTTVDPTQVAWVHKPADQLAHYTRDKRGSANFRERDRSKWHAKQFVCFDGEGCDIEGRHQYVYLAAYDGETFTDITNRNGLGTVECFEFMLDTMGRHSKGIACVYGGNYDANMMMRDIGRDTLTRLHKLGEARWQHYFIRYVPRKYLMVLDRRIKGRCVMLWDVLGFFQSSFITAIDKWLGIDDDTINRGKRSRSSFSIDELDFMASYCRQELTFFYRLMHELHDCLSAAGIRLSRWDGAGAIAAFLYQQHKMRPYMGTKTDQDAHYLEARYAYAGGRFELFMPGDYTEPVHVYDINSAYPYAITQLPPYLGMVPCPFEGDYDHDDEGCIGPYDLLLVDYLSDEHDVNPFFHRWKDGQVGFPYRTMGWHYGVEVLAAMQHVSRDRIVIHEHLVWNDNGMRPFRWVAELYRERARLKAAGDASEKILKLGLNSLYGKLAQQKGWKEGDKIPAWHQLYWAGWVTAKTRTMIYSAIMQNPKAIIATETDSIFSLEPLDLPIGKELGQWDHRLFDWLTYMQSGLYFGECEGELVTKYRGLDKGQLTREKVLKAWERFASGSRVQTIKAKSTRFRTLGTSLAGTTRFDDWRQWVTDTKELRIMPEGKRRHSPLCRERWGRGTHHLTMPVSPNEAERMSAPHNIPWAGDQAAKEQWWLKEEEEWEGIIGET